MPNSNTLKFVNLKYFFISNTFLQHIIVIDIVFFLLNHVFHSQSNSSTKFKNRCITNTLGTRPEFSYINYLNILKFHMVFPFLIFSCPTELQRRQQQQQQQQRRQYV